MQESGIILIADDDEDDVFLFQRSLKALGVKNPTLVLTTGLEVIDYFAGKNLYAKRDLFPLPALTFLDAKMPIHDCFHVLSWIYEQGEILRAIPIVVMSGSIRPADGQRALDLGARAVHAKPLEGDRLRECLALYLPGAIAPER